jgi:pyrimidine deaminase RibD-like protein
MSLIVQVFGHAETARRCPLIGAKQTFRRKAATSVFEPCRPQLAGADCLSFLIAAQHARFHVLHKQGDLKCKGVGANLSR